MADTTFIKGTVIQPAWLNDVNDAIYAAIGDGTSAPALPATVLTNLGLRGAIGSALMGGISVINYGVVADDATARTANTTILRQLISTVANGGSALLQFRGKVLFPLGGTVYLNGVLALRDGMELELNGCTLDFAKTESTAENAAGFIYMRRDCAVRNGYINVDYVSTVADRGNVIKINARYSDTDQAPGNYFLNNFEEDQAAGGTGTGPNGTGIMQYMPGLIELSNLRIKTNNPQAAIVQIFGGVKMLLIHEVQLDGQGVAPYGFDYEFGGATDEVLNQNEKSSHGRNFVFRNIEVKNLDTTTPDGAAIGLRGAYNVLIENLFANSVHGVINIGPGEAENYNPGTEDTTGVKFNNLIRNVVGQSVAGDAFVFDGNSQWTGYLSPLAIQTQANVEGLTTGLVKVAMENFRASGTDNGVGVSTSAGRTILKHGRITGFHNGVFDSGTRDLHAEDLEILSSTSYGVRFIVGSIYPSGWRDRNVYWKGGKISDSTGYGMAFETGQTNAIVEGVTFGSNNRATARLTVTGGTSSPGVNKLSSVTINGVEVLGAAVDWVTSNTATAIAIAAQINSYNSAPEYTATAYNGEVLIQAASGTGTTPNGYVLAVNVGGNVTIGNLKDMSGGTMEATQTASVFVSTGLKNVIVRHCNTLAVAGGGTAYINQDPNLMNNNWLDRNIGDVSMSGFWGGVPLSWTPLLEGHTTPGTQGYATQTGTIQMSPGGLVTFTGNLILNSKDGTTLGSLKIAGLPFTPLHEGGAQIVMTKNLDLNTAGSYYRVSGQIAASAYNAIFLNEEGDNNTVAPLTEADFGAASELTFSGSYFATP